MISVMQAGPVGHSSNHLTVSIHMYTSRKRYATMYDRMTNTTKIFVQ